MGPAGERFAVTPHQGSIRSRDRRGSPGLDSGVPCGYAATSRCPLCPRIPADYSHSCAKLTGWSDQACTGPARTTQQRPGRKRLGSKDFGQHPLVPGPSPSLVRENPRATRSSGSSRTAEGQFRLAPGSRGLAGKGRSGDRRREYRDPSGIWPQRDLRGDQSYRGSRRNDVAVLPRSPI